MRYQQSKVVQPPRRISERLLFQPELGKDIEKLVLALMLRSAAESRAPVPVEANRSCGAQPCPDALVCGTTEPYRRV